MPQRHTSEDIYPIIPPLYTFFSLQHRSHHRNAALVVVMILLYLRFSRSTAKIPYYPQDLRLDVTGAYEAAGSDASAQTSAHFESEAHLTSLIASIRSSYNASHWHQYRPPSYSSIHHRPRLYGKGERKVQRETASTSQYQPVTAVLLNWKRPRALRLVSKHISRYPFIREVIIWNNNIDDHVEPNDFVALLPSTDPPHIRIVNSPSNVHHVGRHIGCSMATYKTCYFNDDDWLNVHMDTLYAKYIDSGAQQKKRIVSSTMPTSYLEDRRWQFHNHDIDLHTGFTRLGTGSMAPRSLSIRFMNQISTFAEEPLLPQELALCDMYFSLWSNSWPDQMTNTPLPIDVDGNSSSSRSYRSDRMQVAQASILDAIRRLHSVLSRRDPHLSPFPFRRATDTTSSHLRSPCANDECLFLTSFNPFPSSIDLDKSYLAVQPIQQAPSKKPLWNFGWSTVTTFDNVLSKGQPVTGFNPYLIGHIREHELQFSNWKSSGSGESRKWPDENWWVKQGSWHYAVNGNPNECWDSGAGPKQGDFFGLQFVQPRLVTQVAIVGSAGIGSVGDQEKHWALQTLSPTSQQWVDRRIVGQPEITSSLAESYIEVSFTLAPQSDTIKRDDLPVTTADDNDDDGKVKSIRLLSRRDDPNTILRLCAWEVDDLKV